MHTPVRWEFKTPLLAGFFESNGELLTSKTHDPRDGSPVGDILLPYRLLTRDGWHGEAREMPHEMVLVQDGFQLRWAASVAHPADLCITTRLGAPGVFDVVVEVEARALLPRYEVFYSNYFAQTLRAGGYVAALPAESPAVPGWTPVFPVADAIFREMYVAFPRDEAGAELICDGRWQRGRHFTRFLPARYYAEPYAYYHHTKNGLALGLMASREDAYAVSMAYRAEEANDSVGQHNSLYLSLFGRDVQAGEKAVARLRMVVDESGRDASRHRATFDAFQASLRAAG